MRPGRCGLKSTRGDCRGTSELSAARGEAPAQSAKRPRSEAMRARRAHCGTFRCRDWSARLLRRQKAHEPLDASMLTLAGLQRVRYVFVYPESGDLVLAGPAGDWKVDADGRIVSTATRRARRAAR